MDCHENFNVHGPQRMNPKNFNYPLSSNATMIYFWVKCLHSAFGWIAMKICYIHVPLRLNCNNVGDSFSFRDDNTLFYDQIACDQNSLNCASC